MSNPAPWKGLDTTRPPHFIGYDQAGDLAPRAMLRAGAFPRDPMDRRLLQTLIEKFGGGPVGIDSLAAALSEERETLEDVVEPFLIQQGFITRTARGRLATAHAYAFFGLPGKPTSDLFATD